MTTPTQKRVWAVIPVSHLLEFLPKVEPYGSEIPLVDEEGNQIPQITILRVEPDGGLAFFFSGEPFMRGMMSISLRNKKDGTVGRPLATGTQQVTLSPQDRETLKRWKDLDLVFEYAVSE